MNFQLDISKGKRVNRKAPSHDNTIRVDRLDDDEQEILNAQHKCKLIKCDITQVDKTTSHFMEFKRGYRNNLKLD